MQILLTVSISVFTTLLFTVAGFHPWSITLAVFYAGVAFACHVFDMWWRLPPPTPDSTNG